MSLPNFMCLGAAKSGTTTLYNILRQHPDIFMPRFKEPHFFDIPDNYKNGIQWYENNYYKNVNKKIITDFTPSYFFEKESAHRIFNDLGRDVKFVILLRNPVDRAYSHYLHSVRDGHEDLPFPEALKSENDRLSQFLEEGDYLAYLRRSYYHQGLYGDMIESYLNYFSLDNFLFIHFEDEFIKSRKKTIIRILDFLDINNQVKLKVDFRSNPASIERSKSLKKIIRKRGWWRKLLRFLVPSVQLRQIIRNKIQTMNIKELEYKRLKESSRRDIYNTYFKEDITKFEKLTNKKLIW